MLLSLQLISSLGQGENSHFALLLQKMKMLHYQEPFGFLQQVPPLRDTDNSNKCLDLGVSNYPGDTLQMRALSLKETIPRLLGFQKVVYDWVFTCVSKVNSALGFNFRSSRGYQINNSSCVLSLGQFPEKPTLCGALQTCLQLRCSNRCSVISPHLPLWILT